MFGVSREAIAVEQCDMNWLTPQEGRSGSWIEKELSRVGVGGGKSRRGLWGRNGPTSCFDGAISTKAWNGFQKRYIERNLKH